MTKALSAATVFFLTFLVLGAPNARAAGASQNGDVVYTVSVADPDATLTDNIFFYTSESGGVTGNLPTLSGEANVVNVGNPFDVQAIKFGLLGIDNISAGGTTILSVYVGFSGAATAPIDQSFTTFFAPFFNAYPDLTVSEDTIVAALQNPNLLDAETSDDNGQIIYQFRDYVEGLADSDTATGADINTGQLTLVHFSDGTAFGDSLGQQVAPDAVPEPSTWAAVLGGCAVLLIVQRRRAASRG